MTDPETKHIRTETNGRVRTLIIDRQEKKNALTQTMYSTIVDEMEAAASDPSVRVVMITGAGGVFTAGNDIAEFAVIEQSGLEAPVFRFLRALPVFPKPLVAAVDGLAVGVGTTMLLHCDLVYASTDAVFSMPFTRLGATPEAGSTLLLPRVAGLQRATEMLMFGEPFDAERAREAGLVNEVIAPEKLLQRAAERAAALAELPPAAIRHTKALIRGVELEQLRAIIDQELVIFRERLSSPESAEAFSAFFEKRPPDFSKFE
jgi:enoyl-CoA hydratase/carnithine racemase